MNANRTKKPDTLQGRLLLLSASQQEFAAMQVQLLRAVDECGSISSAAKQVGISYKTAWDRIEAMNNMSDAPLVVRSAGGAQGGGTALTELGRRVVEGFDALQEEHDAFVTRLGDRLHSLGDIASFTRNSAMHTSARNQYRGVVTRVTPGAVNAEVALQIGPEQQLIAIITNDSVQRMKLAPGTAAIALIKASWVLLSKDTELQSSARNKLIGRISRITQGAVNSEVAIDLGAGKSICAIVTKTSVTELGLLEGDQACAFFKASSVILMSG